MLPLVAMQFTDEVRWSGFDFAVAAMLLLAGGIGVDVVRRASIPRPYAALLALALIAGLALVWAELAVGVFGTPFAGS